MPAVALSTAARPALRSPALRLAARRFQSTSTEKATEAAKDTASKASQGLSRVAGAASGMAKGAVGTLGKLGGRTGKLVALIERQTPFVVYYSKVGLELGKLVFQGQKMAIPSAATFQTFYQNAWQSVRTGSILSSPQALLQSIRNIGTAQLVGGGVVAAECLGFFTVGEMVGRFKVVGYHGEPASHH